MSAMSSRMYPRCSVAISSTSIRCVVVVEMIVCVSVFVWCVCANTFSQEGSEQQSEIRGMELNSAKSKFSTCIGSKSLMNWRFGSFVLAF